MLEKAPLYSGDEFTIVMTVRVDRNVPRPTLQASPSNSSYSSNSTFGLFGFGDPTDCSGADGSVAAPSAWVDHAGDFSWSMCSRDGVAYTGSFSGLNGGHHAERIYRFTVQQDASGLDQYFVDGQQTPTIVAVMGMATVLDWSDATAQGHPIRISASPGQPIECEACNTWVTVDMQSHLTLVAIPPDHVGDLYYYCEYHVAMGMAPISILPSADSDYATSFFPDGVYVDVALRKNSTNVEVFRDGEFMGHTQLGPEIAAWGDSYWVGRAGSMYLNGVVDTIMFFDHAVTDGTLRNMSGAPAAEDSPGMLRTPFVSRAH